MNRYILKKTLRVAVSGLSGCGNTTVSTLLAAALNVRLINYTFRTMAKERGVPLSDILEEAKKSEDVDRHVDTHQVELANEGSCVLGSRLAVWMLKNADLKVYLLASEEERARRIREREGGTLEEVKEVTRKRDTLDSARYKRLYGIDNTAFKSVSQLVIDTDRLKPALVVEVILKELLKRKLIEREA